MAKIQLNGKWFEINIGINLNELLNNLKIKINKVMSYWTGKVVIKTEDERGKVKKTTEQLF